MRAYVFSLIFVKAAVDYAKRAGDVNILAPAIWNTYNIRIALLSYVDQNYRYAELPII